MIKELLHWIWMIIYNVITFHWSHLDYHFTNLWWYLKYGFTYYDLQDMDWYLAKKISVMLDKFVIYTIGYPSGITQEQYIKELKELKYLCDTIWTPKFEDLHWKEQINRKNRCINLIRKYFFHLWF